MAQEAELLYRAATWDESLLQSAGKQAAGPLVDVKSSDEAAVCQLHLPHSETEDGKDICSVNKYTYIMFSTLYHPPLFKS